MPVLVTMASCASKLRKCFRFCRQPFSTLHKYLIRSNSGDNIYPTRISQLDAKQIELYIGPKKRLFEIPVDILEDKLDFDEFDKAFEYQWVSNTLTLPEVEEEVFEMFIRWLNDERLLDFDYPPGLEDATESQLDDLEELLGRGPEDLIKLYALAGDRFWQVRLRDDIITAWFALGRNGYIERYPTSDEVKLTYKLCPPGCQMRRFMAGSLAWMLVCAEANIIRRDVRSERHEHEAAERNAKRKVADDNQSSTVGASTSISQEAVKHPTTKNAPKEDKDVATSPKCNNSSNRLQRKDSLGCLHWSVEQFRNFIPTIDGLWEEMLPRLHRLCSAQMRPADFWVCTFHEHIGDDCTGSSKYPGTGETSPLVGYKKATEIEEAELSQGAKNKIGAEITEKVEAL